MLDITQKNIFVTLDFSMDFLIKLKTNTKKSDPSDLSYGNNREI